MSSGASGINLVSRAIGLAGVSAAWLIGSQHAQATDDSRLKTADDRANTAAYMDTFTYDQGNYSGNPMFDEAASGLHGLKVKWDRFMMGLQAHSEHVMRDVIGDNLPWIGLGVAGLYIGARDIIGSASKGVWSVVSRPLGVLWEGTKKMLRESDSMGKLGRALKGPLTRLAEGMVANAPATLLLGLGTWFAADKLMKTYRGEAAQDYFAEEMLEGSPGTSATFSFMPYGNPVQ
jgi:hypothetical protein